MQDAYHGIFIPRGMGQPFLLVPVEIAARSFPIFAGSGFTDVQLTAFVLLIIKSFDCLESLCVVGHLNKCEASGTSGFSVSDDVRGYNFAVLSEKLTQSGFIRSKTQIAHVNLLSHFLSFVAYSEY